MMQRSIYIFCLALFMISFVPQTRAQKGKSEIATGYGYYSQYSLFNGVPFTASSGVPVLTYRYYISKSVTLGLGLGYENISTKGNYVTIAPELTVAYMDTRNDLVRVRLYGAVSYGVSILDDYRTKMGFADESGPKAYGFQGTPFGIRLGRQFACFMEIGFGYKGLVHGGIEVRIPKILKHRNREEK